MNYRIVKLKEVAEVVSGSTPSTSNALYWNGNIRWITPAELNDGHNWYLFDTDRKISEKALKDCNLKMLNKGTVLLTSRAPIGKVALAGSAMCTNQGFKNIVCNPCFINSEYLYFWLLGKKEYLNSLGRGATFKEISKKIVENIEVTLPEMKIQKKIVDILHKSLSIIDKRKAQIEALDQLTQSVFLEMFGHLEGEKKPLSVYCYVNPSKKETEKINDDQLVTFLPMSSVSDKGEIDLSTVKKIKDVRNGFTYFKDNDVIFAKITPCMENGKGAMVRNLVNGIGFGSTEFHVLRPKEKVNSYWLYYLTALPSFRRQAQKNMTGSAGQKRVPKQFFDKYKVVLPPIELQNQFAEIVQNIESQKVLLEQSLTQLENNFQSLMQRAFRGELFSDQNEQPEQTTEGSSCYPISAS